MPVYYDVHTHTDKRFENVVQIRSLFPDQLKLIQQQPERWYSVGWHPWHVDAQRSDEIFSLLEKAVRHEKVIAVGETGLDRSIETPINLQHNIFSRHLSLAEKAGMPVIVHAVKSYPDIIRVYKESKAHVPLIIHGFRGNQQAAGQLLQTWFLSLIWHRFIKTKFQVGSSFSKYSLATIVSGNRRHQYRHHTFV